MRGKFLPGYWPALIALLLGLALIYRNDLYWHFFPRTPPLWSQQRGDLHFEIKASENSSPKTSTIEPFRLYPLKLSVDFEVMRPGCEWFYGRVEKHSAERRIRESTAQNQEAAWKDRYLIRFEYDHRNRRCESKELWIDDRMGNQLFYVQLIKIEGESGVFSEEAWLPLYRLDVQKDVLGLQAKVMEIHEPGSQWAHLKESYSIQIQKHFSSLTRTGIHHAVAPWESLKDRLLDEIKLRTARCQTGDCQPIWMSVATLADSEIEIALEEAERAGIPVEVLTNTRLQHPKIRKLTEHFVPWQWSLGPAWKDYALLPLHTKFAIFGNELVLSSSANFEFNRFFRSREWWTTFSQTSIVRMFQTIQFFTRTNLFIPLTVDFRDPFVLLFTADRSRLYSSSFRRAYSLISTQEAVQSSGYGIALELIRRDPGPIQLWMSPLKDSCYFYRDRLCFFSVLQEKAFGSGLEAHLNSFFYLTEDNQPRARLTKETTYLRDPSQLFLYQLRDERISSHHERIIKLSDRVILGSANFAHRSSVNTIEISKDSALMQRVNLERSAFLDPYFVLKRHPLTESSVIGECQFVFETELGGKTQIGNYRWRRQELEDRFDLRSKKVDIWTPKDPINPQLGFISKPLTDDFVSPSQSLCLEVRNPSSKVSQWIPVYAPSMNLSLKRTP